MILTMEVESLSLAAALSQMLPKSWKRRSPTTQSRQHTMNTTTTRPESSEQCIWGEQEWYFWLRQGAQGVSLSVCLSGTNLSKAFNLHLKAVWVSPRSVPGQSQVSPRSVPGSQVSPRSVTGQSQVSLRSVSGQSQVRPRSLLGLS